jgi:hypothetical protein
LCKAQCGIAEGGVLTKSDGGCKTAIFHSKTHTKMKQIEITERMLSDWKSQLNEHNEVPLIMISAEYDNQELGVVLMPTIPLEGAIEILEKSIEILKSQTTETQ